MLLAGGPALKPFYSEPKLKLAESDLSMFVASLLDWLNFTLSRSVDWIRSLYCEATADASRAPVSFAFKSFLCNPDRPTGKADLLS